MRKIDNLGLILCDLQSELFEESHKLNCSSEVFIRRFMNSNIVKEFDKEAILDDTLTKDDIFDALEEEYGISNYGSIKYTKEELYWIGHIYRYFSYTYELPSKKVYKIIKPKELRSLYQSYHTFDTEFALERILEAKKIDVNIDYTEKMLELLRKKINNQNTYYITVEDKDFDKNKEKKRNIEFMVDKEIKVKDVIVYKNNANKESFKTRVVDIYFFNNYEELYNAHKKLIKEYEEKINIILQKYSEEINKYGISMIEVEEIK